MPTQFEHRITFTKEAESLEEFHIHYGIVYRQELMSTMGSPLSATPSAPTLAPTLSLRFLNEPTWEGLLEKYKDNVPLDISPGKWRPSSSGNMSIGGEENDGVILKCIFGDVDKWCYPRLAVSEGIDLTKYSGVILRGRTRGETTPRFFLYERDTGAGYMTDSALFPADGEWHVLRIPFNRLSYCGATPADPNGRLDLENVNALSIGFNTKSREATLEISDCILVQP